MSLEKYKKLSLMEKFKIKAESTPKVVVELKSKKSRSRKTINIKIKKRR
jgi:hypothetical protein